MESFQMLHWCLTLVLQFHTTFMIRYSLQLNFQVAHNMDWCLFLSFPCLVAFIVYDACTWYPWLIMVIILRFRSSLIYPCMILCTTWNQNSCSDTLCLQPKTWRASSILWILSQSSLHWFLIFLFVLQNYLDNIVWFCFVSPNCP